MQFYFESASCLFPQSTNFPPFLISFFFFLQGGNQKCFSRVGLKTSCSVLHSLPTNYRCHSSEWCARGKTDTQRPAPSAVAISSHLTKNNTSHASSDLLFETVKRAPSTEGSFCRSPRELVKNNSQPTAAPQQDSWDRIQLP